MPASAIASAVISAFAIESVIAVAAVRLATALVTSIIVSKLFAPNDPGSFSSGADPGVRSRLPTSPENKVGVGYGNFWCKGAVIHGENTSDFKTAYYVMALSESIDSAPNSLLKVYWQEFLLTLDGNGNVTNAVDAQGNSVSDFNGNIRVQFFASGLPASRTALPNTTWFQDATKLLSGYSCVVVTVNYNRDKQIFSLQDMTFNLQNSLSAPGAVISDYMQNVRYGGNIPASLIDTTSLTALDTYSAQQLPYTSGGSTLFANRYAINGMINTNNDCWTNLEEICRCSGAIMQVLNGGGKFGVFIDRIGTSVFSLSDNQIVGNSTVTLSDLTTVPNQLVTNYADGSNQFKGLANTFTFNTPSNLLPNTAPVVQQQTSFALVNNSVQAKRLATLELNQWQLDLSYNFIGDHRLLGLNAGDVVAITDTRNGWTNKLFRIASISEEEAQDGAISVEVTTKEYSDAIYNDSAILSYDPSPNVNTPSARFLNSYTPATPTVAGATPTGSIPVFNINLTIPVVRVDYLEVYYSTDPVNNFALLFSQRATTVNGVFATGTLSTPVTGLLGGTYYFRVKYFNSDIASNLSLASVSFIWDPQPSSTSSGVSVNFDWSPPNVLVPAQFDGSSPVTGQTPILCLYIGTSQIQFSTAATDTALPNNQWRITTVTPTTGLTVSAASVSGSCALFTVTGMTAQAATLTLAINYKTTTGTVVSIGTTILQVVQQRAGSAGTAGWAGYINIPVMTFNQALDGTWPATQNMIGSFTNGVTVASKTQPVSVNASGNIVYGTPTGSTDITISTTGAGTKAGTVQFTHTPSSVSVTATVNSTSVSAALTVDKAQALFAQNNDGTYTAGSQNITATVAQTNGSATSTATVVATIVANGNITLTYPTPTAGITTAFTGNGSKTTAVQFTHTATGATGAASAVAQIFPITVADNFGGVTVSVSGVTTGTIAAPVAITQTYSNSSTFSKAADGGAWTPTPVANVITTNNTIVANRQTTTLARIIRVLAYNTNTGVWTDTADTSQDLNPTRFTLGTATSSSSQYSRSITYTDTDGTQIDVLQVNAIVGGSRGSPGPANVVRYGRFASNAQALVTGAPTNASGVDNINWFRSPSVFQANNPYTHTTSQFVNNVTAGAPWQATEALSGSGGGAYLPGLNEVYTETITGGHTASTRSNEVVSFAVTGNSGTFFSGYFIGVVNNRIFGTRYINSSTIYILTSTDGLSWVFVNFVGIYSFISLVAYGNSIYVAYGNGNFFTSLDGITFTYTATPLNSANGSRLLFGTTRFVLLTNNRILYSVDGVTWSNATLPIEFNDFFSNLTLGNNFWMAYTSGNAPRILTSSDGITWIFNTTLIPTEAITSITFGNNIWAVKTNSTLYVSANNGTSWSVSGTNVTPIFGNSIWVGYLGNTIYSATDALTWTSRTTTPASVIYLTFKNGYFLVNAFSLLLYYSTNGTTWASGTSPTSFIYALEFLGSNWLMRANDRLFYTPSTPPISGWLTQNTSPNLINCTINYFSNTQQSLNYVKGINLDPNISSQAALGANFISKISVGAPAELSFTLNASNAVQINYLTAGDAASPTFVVTQSSGGTTASTIVVGTQTVVAGNSPSTITFNNVQVASNRAQYQITGAPAINGNIYTWPISVLSSTGTLLNNSPVVFDAQLVLQGIVYEGTGTYLTVLPNAGLSGTNLFLSSNTYGVIWNGSVPGQGFGILIIERVTFIDNNYIYAIRKIVSVGTPYIGALISNNLTTWTYAYDNVYLHGEIVGANGLFISLYFANPNSTQTLIAKATSVTGTWTDISSSLPTLIGNVAVFANNQFYVYCAGTANGIYRSPDLLNWTSFVGNFTIAPTQVIFAENIFVMQYLEGGVLKISTSTDGINFTTRLTTDQTSGLSATSYAGGYFFVITGQDPDKMYYSDDAINWQTFTFTNLPAGGSAYSIAFGNGSFVLTTGTNIVLTSTNLTTWVQKTISPNTFDFFDNIIFQNNRFNLITVVEDFGATYSIYLASSAFAWTGATTLSLIPSAYPSIQANLQALTTNNYIFLQGSNTAVSALTVLFSSGAAANQQALDIATAFNTQEIAYTAAAASNVVTITSSQQANYTDITHGAVTQGSNGNIVIGDFALVKTQDGRMPNSVSQGTQSTILFTKAGNYGVGSATLTLDFGQAFNAAGFNNNVTYSGTINGVATGTVVLGNVSPYVAVQQLLQAMGYVVAIVNANTLRAYDVDTTAGGDLTISVTSNGSNPTGNFAIATTVVDTGTTEIVVGDPNRWSIPVNTGRAIN